MACSNDGNLEEGSFRCDANVSVRRRGSEKLGTRVELKNINSFRFVRQAIDFEIHRQVQALEGGERIVQETRLYDHEKNVTRPMRSKEAANDYRYFPEPDLAPLVVAQELIDRVTLPKLPAQLTAELLAAGVPAADARTLVGDPRLLRLHAQIGSDARRAALFLTGELARAVNEKQVDLARLQFDPALVAEVWALQDAGTISSTAAREVFSELVRSGKPPAQIVLEKGLAQVSDEAALAAVVDALLARSPKEAASYRAGNAKVLGFFVGAAMKELKGKGNPGALNALFKSRLGG